MIVFAFVCVALVVYLGIRLPSKVNLMTEEGYRQYFCRSIMGMK